MLDKLPVLIAYAVVGLAIGLWPVVSLAWAAGPRRGTAGHDAGPGAVISGVVAAGAAALIVACFGPRFAVAAAIVASGALLLSSPAQPRAQVLAGALAALAAAATAPWWKRMPPPAVQLSWRQAALFAGLMILVLAAFRRQRWRVATARLATAALFAAYAIGSVYISFATGIFENSEVLLTAWNHWGAYVAPAELLLSGARPFHDMPLQYGLGPTLLIASTCGVAGCWSGMSFLVGALAFAYGLVCGALALVFAIRAGLSMPSRALVLVSTFLCCFLWDAYPPSAASPAVRPSTAGFRFLPVLSLAALVVWRYGRGEHRSYRLGHIAWAACSSWSPESAFYATFLWWPFYLYAACANAARSELWRRAANSVGVLIGCLFLLVLAIVAGCRVTFGAYPTFYGYWAYVLDPPGVLPVNPLGTLWFFLGVLAVGSHGLHDTFRRSGDCRDVRGRFITLLLAYGTFSYYLGRSHDNNILNLAPSLLLVLVASLGNGTPAFTTATRILFASTIAWVAAFGWAPWGDAAGAGRLLEFAPRRVREAFSYGNPATIAWMVAPYHGYNRGRGDPSEAGRAIADITAKYGEPITVLDNSMVLIPTAKPSAWSAIHDPANYVYMPSGQRRTFIRETAGRLGRMGWLVVDRWLRDHSLIDDLESAYQRVEMRDYGTYYAVRYRPLTGAVENPR